VIPQQTLNKRKKLMLKNKIEKIKEHQKTLYLIVSVCGAFLVIILSLVLVFRLNAQIDRKNTALKKEINNTKKEVLVKNGEMRLIDGLLVEKGRENNLPIAVMIDNHKDAWPPAGIDKANLVYEVEAEGGMTRYLAFFTDYQDIPEIGPIRSARPYYVDIAREYGALYVHVGGSPEALVKIKQEWVLDINEFYNEKYFWRAVDRFAPHNVMSSGDLLTKYLTDKKIYSKPKYFPWAYSEDLAKEKRPLKSGIIIDFSLKDYKVEWKYNKDDNHYVRFLNNFKQQTSEGNEIIAKNIIIQTIEAEVIDEELRLRMDIVGTGKATICRDGICRDGEWNKDNSSARTRYYLAGEEVKLVPGTTWVEIIRPEIGIELY
jgi:hypothetical protein